MVIQGYFQAPRVLGKSCTISISLGAHQTVVSPQPSEMCPISGFLGHNIGALRITVEFGLYFSIVVKRNTKALRNSVTM